MSEIEENHKVKVPEVTVSAEVPKRKAKGSVFGLIGMALGVLAWLVLYHSQWLGLSLASLGFVISLFGFRGRIRSFSVGGLVICGTLLLVVGMMYAAICYIFESIQ